MFDRICRYLRFLNDLSRKELANILGISEQAVGQFENNKKDPSLQTLSKLADYFKVSIDFLLGREDSEVKQAVLIIDRLNEFINKLNYSYADLAADIGESPNEIEAILEYEKTPSRQIVEAVCKKYGLQITHFYPNDKTYSRKYEYLMRFYLKEENFEYLELAILIKEQGYSPKDVRELLKIVKGIKR